MESYLEVSWQYELSGIMHKLTLKVAVKEDCSRTLTLEQMYALPR